MRLKQALSLILLVGAMLYAAPGTFGQDGLQPAHLQDFQRVTQVKISPEGNYVAYVLSYPKSVSEGVGTDYRQLYVYNVAEDAHAPLLDKEVKVTSVGWSPDGKYITYRAADKESGTMQVFAISPAGKDKKQLTKLSRSVQHYDFINANTLAITAESRKGERKKELLDKGFNMNIVEEELPSLDLWRYDLEHDEKKQLTEGVAVFDFKVSPDGSKIAAAIASDNTTDAYYMFKRVTILEAESGKVLKKIENPGKLANMAWSPDSKMLAFRAASKKADAVTGSLFVFETGEDVKYADIPNVVEDMQLSVVDMQWKDKNSLLFASEKGVDITLRALDVDAGTQNIVLKGGKAVFSNFSLQGSSVYFAGNTPKHPSELMQYDLENNKLKKRSEHNAWLDDVNLARQEKISYKAKDGTRIDGVLIYPLDYEEDKSYPLVTYIHGGPEAAVHNGWVSRYSMWGQFAAANDFFVFAPNYRASSGRGVEYTMAGFNDLLGKEYADVLDGIDYLIDEGMVDQKRVGIGGGSYGGYFAAWSATKHTDRFAASVVFVGVTNQLSKRNITDIPWEDYLVHWGFWSHEDYERVWNVSPVKYAHQSKTPTLVLHGEEDPRVPISQGEELYRAMKIHTDTPVRFVTYPGEGHGNRKNTNQYDYLVRTLNWFNYYLKENPGATDKPSKYPEYQLEK